VTLTLFKTYVKRDFKRTDKDTEIVNAYNDMIMWVAAQMPHGNYKYQSYISTVSAQEDYPLPSNIMHLIHPIKLLEGSGTNDHGWPLDHISKEEYDALYPNPNRTSPTDTGRPSVYCIFSSSILLGPLPNSSSFLLEINWGKRPTALSADADVPDLGSEWDEVLKFGVLERVYAGMGMLEEANYWGGLYRDNAGIPVGMARQLFDLEKNRESRAVSQIQNNSL
jgi:hypothetical protein